MNISAAFVICLINYPYIHTYIHTYVNSIWFVNACSKGPFLINVAVVMNV